MDRFICRTLSIDSRRGNNLSCKEVTVNSTVPPVVFSYYTKKHFKDTSIGFNIQYRTIKLTILYIATVNTNVDNDDIPFTFLVK